MVHSSVAHQSSPSSVGRAVPGPERDRVGYRKKHTLFQALFQEVCPAVFFTVKKLKQSESTWSIITRLPCCPVHPSYPAVCYNRPAMIHSSSDQLISSPHEP